VLRELAVRMVGAMTVGGWGDARALERLRSQSSDARTAFGASVACRSAALRTRAWPVHINDLEPRSSERSWRGFAY